MGHSAQDGDTVSVQINRLRAVSAACELVQSAPAEGNFPGNAPRSLRSSARTRWTRLVGRAASVRRLEAAMMRVAEFQCTTLVTGETGCGKEEVARAIHAAGTRHDKPFISVNCGSLPASIAESQLFGHERGAFTGAIGATRGAFRAAHGGVLFLDEVGELAEEVQPKLLQVLERREVTPVGSTRPEPIDVQVIAATNRDLEVAVAKGGFREDLLYRLNTVHLRVPPLRERAEDIPAFIEHFGDHYAAQYGRSPWRPGPELLARLVAYAWPGNVRQLVQTIQQLYIFADSADAVLDDLFNKSPPQFSRPAGAIPLTATNARGTDEEGQPPQGSGPPTFNLRELRRRTVRAAIETTHGHLGKAAALLGVCPNTMTKLVAEACPERLAVRRRSQGRMAVVAGAEQR